MPASWQDIRVSAAASVWVAGACMSRALIVSKQIKGNA